jgi:multisubunit Na+/H+ antiporter MnhB subunit
MTARMQLALMRMDDPRIARLLMLGLAMVLALAMHGSPGGAEAAYACPSTGGGGCTGG